MFGTKTRAAAALMLSIIAALALLLVIRFIADAVYSVGAIHDEPAYFVEVPGAGPRIDPLDPVEFARIFEAADPVRGESLWRSCRMCHSLEAGDNRTGPSLAGVVGRAVDTAPGFAYSGALERVVTVWTPDRINALIANPRRFAPGTLMTYTGMRNAQDRADLIAFLQGH
ncbi:c-type cytochrome [Ketogulonicigenium vulgare]|uniref:Cytochrome c, class I n=1 Tax=Ketogulonicigenium vulgare (strain WSH-001) TaxID=759362 RepID=F9YA93_KETVW|nr:c-type cytochrome [Ketogulonicigenium vulgare]ADO42046.1 cytochrome c, class I [Ketogulonicigenium vulgare Y25]AEM40266.1 cytochrome c, class I [Ketogulonicigenium vulgare WSH-001]ALJ80465.1 cytochrome C [Ketogulonicigenium vulgare]ANW33293.1 cytochrome C [Ketogulonicigenium vulgare]AOZ53973.1 cytochrome C, class I [Ketogulonicigenium vulgare]